MALRMRLALPVMVLILLAGLAGGCSKDMFAEEADKDNLSVKLARETVKGGYQLMTAGELKKALEGPNPPLVVDTMPFEASYKKEHVPGSVNFEFPIEPMPEWDAAKTGGKSVQDFEKALGPDKNRPIVFYCGFVKCTRSDNGAVWAKKLGYVNVTRFPGGIYAWKGQKYPVETAK